MSWLKSSLFLIMAMIAGISVASADSLRVPEPPVGYYVRGEGGWNWVGRGLEQSPFFGGGVGYRFSQRFRGDLRGEYGFDYSVLDDSVNPPVKEYYQIAVVTANAYIDIPVRSPILPYVGFGVGYGWVDFDDEWAGACVCVDQQSVVGALMVGFSYQITNRTAFDVEYRLRHWFTQALDDQSVLLAVRYAF